ncbi:hypothetical protein [Flavobacterium rhizosphaerae]|uniref:DUF2281 domain-containing protein n=1 Tax=Flavobacterium rhizosphaerae TaxID=3163298 RepID=A0ABW8YUD4_9FLAO
MNTEETKKEIVKLLDTLPEDTLETVLGYLKNVASSNLGDVQFSRRLRKIIEEDKQMLNKLGNS